jgi:cellulose synthase/poly-beta-1,6-N-acetylglucosamine synthase-like glycosyltransferase
MHERNLFELGEDRMHTTLLLQHIYGMRLNFVPEAICWTIVPHTFWVLVSQRRRWINSTIHNMLELMKVQTTCGACVFSMKVVVISDLLSSFLLPSGSLYLYYVVFRTAITQEYTVCSLCLGVWQRWSRHSSFGHNGISFFGSSFILLEASQCFTFISQFMQSGIWMI